MHSAVEGLRGRVEVVELEMHYAVEGLTGGVVGVIVYFVLGQKKKFVVVKEKKMVALTEA